MFNKQKLITVILLVISITFETVTRTRDWFYFYPWIDNPMHFLWGAAIFSILTVFMKLPYKYAFIGIIAKQVIWESLEIIGDQIIPQPNYMLDILWPDGVQDTIFDLLGAFGAYLLIKYKTLLR